MTIEKSARIPVHVDDDGMLWAEDLDRPGLFASGANLVQLVDAIIEAQALYDAEDGER